MSAGDETLSTVARVLSEEAFSVTRNVSVEGLSGYNHVFSFLARKGDKTLLIDVAHDIFSFLASLAKRIDIPEYRFLVIVKERVIKKVLPDIVDWRPESLENVTVISYNGPDDLQEKLHSLLRSMVPQ